LFSGLRFYLYYPYPAPVAVVVWAVVVGDYVAELAVCEVAFEAAGSETPSLITVALHCAIDDASNSISHDGIVLCCALFVTGACIPFSSTSISVLLSRLELPPYQSSIRDTGRQLCY
jgi:hypothetical protein